MTAMADLDKLEELAKAATAHLAGHDLKASAHGRMIFGQSKKGGDAHVLDIRGWGYLTGKGGGALGLSEEQAIEAQKAVEAYAVAAWNAVPELIALARRDGVSDAHPAPTAPGDDREAVQDAFRTGFLCGVGREPWEGMNDYAALCAVEYSNTALRQPDTAADLRETRAYRDGMRVGFRMGEGGEAERYEAALAKMQDEITEASMAAVPVSRDPATMAQVAAVIAQRDGRPIERVMEEAKVAMNPSTAEDACMASGSECPDCDTSGRCTYVCETTPPDPRPDPLEALREGLEDVADTLRVVSNDLWDQVGQRETAQALMNAALRLERLAKINAVMGEAG